MPFDKTDNSGLAAEEIRNIQSRLACHGFDPGPVDGIFGPRTSAAVIAFKRFIGFVPRAWVGPKTWEALMLSPQGETTGPANLIDAPWVKIGLKMKGLHEVRDNAALRAFLASDGHALGDPAVFPWCGDFAETCIKLALPDEPFPGDLGRNPYWALNWRLLGDPLTAPLPGCVFSISRNGGGHVGFVLGQDATRYYCLGGNQSNTVSIAPIEKSRFVPQSFRWPMSYPQPDGPLPQMASLEAATAQFA